MKKRTIKTYTIYIDFMGEKEKDQEFHSKKEAEEALVKVKEQNKTLGVPASVYIEAGEKEVESNPETLVAFYERNGWERETWRWWFLKEKYEKNEEKYHRLRDLLKKAGKMDQKIGFTSFGFDDLGCPRDEIQWDEVGYRQKNIEVNGDVDENLLSEWEHLDPDYLIVKLYKGGLDKLLS